MVDQEHPTVGLAVRCRDGAIFLIEGRRSMLVELPGGPTANGSGSPYALAAMACGKSAVEAVEIAARFDDGTGFGVDSWTYGSKKRRR